MKIQDMMYMLWKKITSLTMNNIGYLGANITQGKTNDTYAFWVDKPSGEVYFNTIDMLNGQPDRYGVLYHDNFYTGYINQTFTTPTGVVYRRHANGSTSSTFTDWVLADTGREIVSTQTFTYNNNETKSFVFNRVGNVIFMDSPVDIGDLPTGTTTLGTLKEDLRPKYPVRLRPGNSPMNYNFFFSIDTNGTVALYTSTAITGPANCALHTSYLASDI